MQRNLILFAVVIGAVLAFTVALDRSAAPSRKSFDARPEINDVKTQAAPDFRFTPLKGKMAYLSDYKGKVVLLNFWASWCGPCVIEFPKFAELAKAHPDKLVILALSADTEKKDIERFLKKIDHQDQANFVIAHDKNKKISQDLFQTIRLPETIIINTSGKMVRKVIGDTDWTGPEMRDYLTLLASEKPIP